jgi:NADH:ubiquinone oxidoreductase subunit 6 (subunit J)
MIDAMLLFVFAVLSALAVISAYLVALERSVFHSALSLAAVFTFGSLLLLFIGQYVIALLQLFVLVGGLSVYLVVSVASEAKIPFRKASIPMLIILSVFLFALLSYYMIPGLYNGTVQGLGNASSGSAIYNEAAASLSNMWQLVAIVLLFMFAIGIGGIVVIKSSLAKKK